jgi:hypothetical protein
LVAKMPSFWWITARAMSANRFSVFWGIPPSGSWLRHLIRRISFRSSISIYLESWYDDGDINCHSMTIERRSVSCWRFIGRSSKPWLSRISGTVFKKLHLNLIPALSCIAFDLTKKNWERHPCSRKSGHSISIWRNCRQNVEVQSLDGLTNLNKRDWWMWIVIRPNGCRDIAVIPKVKTARILVKCRVISFVYDKQIFFIFDYAQHVFKDLRLADPSVP